MCNRYCAAGPWAPFDEFADLRTTSLRYWPLEPAGEYGPMQSPLTELTIEQSPAATALQAMHRRIDMSHLQKTIEMFRRPLYENFDAFPAFAPLPAGHDSVPVCHTTL
jgi:hypothetical protein